MDPAAPPPPAPARAWLVVALLCVVGALNYLDRNMITTMRQSIVEAVPMTDAQFGLLTSVFLWVYGILSPFAGYLADRFNRSRVIIASLFVWSAVTWLTAHARTFDQLLAARALMGVSEACYIPAALALIADYHRGATRSTATGIHMAGIMVGSGLGGIGGWFADRREWSYPFLLFGVVGVIYAAVLLLLLRDPPRSTASDSNAATPPPNAPPIRFGAALISLFRSPGYVAALAAWGLLGVAGWMLVVWAPTYFLERFHLSQGTAGFSVTGYMSGAAVVGVLLGGGLADAWSRSNARARILVPALGLCAAAPGILLMAHTSLLPVAIAGLVVYGVTRNFVDSNMMPILCLIADARYRATGYGFLNLCSCIVGGIGIYAGGALRDVHFSLDRTFLFVAVCIALCGWLLFRIRPVPLPVANRPS